MLGHKERNQKFTIPTQQKRITPRVAKYPADTGRKLNVHKTFRTSSERLMYVQLKSCVCGVGNQSYKARNLWTLDYIRNPLKLGKFLFQVLLKKLKNSCLRVETKLIKKYNYRRPQKTYVTESIIVQVKTSQSCIFIFLFKLHLTVDLFHPKLSSCFWFARRRHAFK